jgi:hypothetical protein
MGPKERHLKDYQENGGEMSTAVLKILQEGSIGHDHKRLQEKRTSGKSRTRNQGGSPTTGR